ncbi:MAG: SDR family NAD(P)-dependent oxidoreductase [Actinomycetota bacterium]|nr:SDR family NAD(P)-dependent oxidoreductase [Actinomycetota bacterium]
MDAGPDDQSTQPWWRGVVPGRRLAGKRAFVTGAGMLAGGELFGIGEAIAVLFAAQGAAVAVADVSRARAEATVELISGRGGMAMATVGDLSSISDSERCVSQADDALGGLDTVVNCAALPGGGGSPVDVAIETWEQVMAVNLHATFLTARHAIPRLRRAGGGSIVNISSVAASRGHGSGAYAASKAAMLGLTRDWAYLHGRDGIRVNCILPGHVHTPMGLSGGEEMREIRRACGLLGTEGDAWDVAWPAVFLASEESRWITGVELPVDAGTTSSGALAIHVLNSRSPV